MTKRRLSQLTILLVFLSATFLLLGELEVVFQSEEVKSYINYAGVLATVVYAILYLLTLIFAPITGLPFWITGVGLFGIFKTVIITYLVAMIGSVINFFISRKFGRPLLAKLVGEGGVQRIDRLTKNFGTETLILTRLFQGFIFEWISYAAGLTNINFKKYLLITLFASIPLNLISLFLGLQISNLAQLFITITMVNYILMTVPFIYFLLKKIKIVL
ncbi:MAG: TVP38/TMEM64 family protein [Candidatus Colwellbacteria bacterium]|nr:TVP38/TMEM64 family protein [Candidatus Colwellbacteria bacterium]